ncbi:MAG: amino acid transporter, partial [Alphaproteobacteria bacterium]|nr:amino acid transporter [Alphaproteobacteria bacterium]
WQFAVGAYLASTMFFYGLGYGAKAIGRGLTSPKIWTRIDFGIAVVMFWIAAGLIWAGFSV